MKLKPIVVVVAMKSELEYLLNKLEDCVEHEENIYTFYEGYINDYPVIIEYCKMMTFNAAIATHIAIEKYSPKMLIVQGTAGAHTVNLHNGDIVIGTKCININSVKTPFKDFGEGSNSIEWHMMSYINDEENRLEYFSADAKLLNIAQNVDYKESQVVSGIIGSGDIWNNEKDKIKYLNEKYETLSEDMESISVYKLANNYRIPAIGVRVISNNLLTGEKFDETTTLKLQKFTYNFLEDIIKNK